MLDAGWTRGKRRHNRHVSGMAREFTECVLYTFGCLCGLCHRIFHLGGKPPSVRRPNWWRPDHAYTFICECARLCRHLRIKSRILGSRKDIYEYVHWRCERFGRDVWWCCDQRFSRGSGGKIARWRRICGIVKHAMFCTIDDRKWTGVAAWKWVWLSHVGNYFTHIVFSHIFFIRIKIIKNTVLFLFVSHLNKNPESKTTS